MTRIPAGATPLRDPGAESGASPAPRATHPGSDPPRDLAEPAPRLELDSPAVRDNPYELYARWRSTEPVRRGALGEWYPTRYDDVLAVLADPAGFSNNLAGTWLYEEQMSRLRVDGTQPVIADVSMLRADPRITRGCAASPARRSPRAPWPACGRGSSRSWTTSSRPSRPAPSS